MNLVDRVRTSVDEALVRLAGAGALGERGDAAVRDVRTTWTVERPKRAEHGDYATNVAMTLTKRVGMPPRAIADALVKSLESDAVVESAEIAGPGFVNLRIRASAIHAEVRAILDAGTNFGRAPALSGERIDIEFVSANPTGPITVAAARNAILGDAIAKLLELQGCHVTREYYINDNGNQIRVFAESVRLAHEGKPRGEGTYQGEYIEEIARFLETKKPDPFASGDDDLARISITAMLQGIPGSKTLRGIRRTLANVGIWFDVWFSEESLHRWGSVDVGVERLRELGYLAEKDGALWFVTNDENASADKDRVIRKTDGSYTYFAADIAYHVDKLSRGYDRLLIVLGADHHGYIPRMKNVLAALGLGADKYEQFIYQLVNILRGGELVKSSKRAGNVVTADEVMEEIDEAVQRPGAGRDAIRFFFLSRSANSTVDFDLDLAKKKSLDNPVFYVQYGHARLASVLKKAESLGMTAPPSREAWAKLVHPDELAIARQIARWPDVAAEAANLREPHRVVYYVQELARDFQSYFTRLKADPILPPDSVRAQDGWDASWDHDKTRARLAWVRAIKIVYAAALDALGVSAPERMDLPQGDEDAMPEGAA